MRSLCCCSPSGTWLWLEWTTSTSAPSGSWPSWSCSCGRPRSSSRCSPCWAGRTAISTTESTCRSSAWWGTMCNFACRSALVEVLLRISFFFPNQSQKVLWLLQETLSKFACKYRSENVVWWTGIRLSLKASPSFHTLTFILRTFGQQSKYWSS